MTRGVHRVDVDQDDAAFDVFVLHAAADRECLRGYLVPALNLLAHRRKPSDLSERELQDAPRACVQNLKAAADRLRIPCR